MMSPLFTVSALVVLFVFSHIALSSNTLRPWLVERLGDRGFFVFYSLLSAVLYALLVQGYASRRFDGPRALALGASPVLRWPLMTLAAVGITLAGAGLVAYPRLPSALFDQAIRGPYGVERISRHPFFAGFALFALAHALMVTHLVSVVFFAGLALLAIVGARFQDSKLAQRRGEAYERYLGETSFWPFGAQLAWKHRRAIALPELPWFALGGSFLFALWTRWAHASLFDHDGLWVILALVGGAALASLTAWRRARRKRL